MRARRDVGVRARCVRGAPSATVCWTTRALRCHNSLMPQKIGSYPISDPD